MLRGGQVLKTPPLSVSANSLPNTFAQATGMLPPPSTEPQASLPALPSAIDSCSPSVALNGSPGSSVDPPSSLGNTGMVPVEFQRFISELLQQIERLTEQNTSFLRILTDL